MHYQGGAITEATAEPVNSGITETWGTFPSCFLCSYILHTSFLFPFTKGLDEYFLINFSTKSQTHCVWV